MIKQKTGSEDVSVGGILVVLFSATCCYRSLCAHALVAEMFEPEREKGMTRNQRCAVAKFDFCPTEQQLLYITRFSIYFADVVVVLSRPRMF